MASQWLSLVAAIWLQSISATNSNFPAYSSQLKLLLSVSQLQINNLAFASDAGKLFGFFSGLAALHLPLWLVLLIGSALGLLGYGVQYLLLLTHRLSSLPYALVFLLTAVAGNGITWINTVSYVVAIQNFPLDRQLAVGLSTSYQGLSAKLYADVAEVFFRPGETARPYLFLNCILPPIVCLTASPLVGAVRSGRSKRLSDGFAAITVITVLTGSYAVVTSVESVRERVGSPVAILTGMCVLLAAPVVIPVAEKVRERVALRCKVRRRVFDESGVEEESGGVVNGDGVKDEGVIVYGDEEVGVKSMVKRVEFWVYFGAYMLGASIGMVYLNNLGQIGESRGLFGNSTLVPLASSFGFFGRLFPCLLDYYLSRRKYKVSRPLWMALTMVPMTAAFFLLVDGSSAALHVSTAVIGACTGAVTSISVSATAELFGAKNFGVNHNVVVANIPIASFLFGDLAAVLYRRQGMHGKCMGTKCYQTTFLIWGSLCFLGTFLAIILHMRTKK